MEVKNLLQTNRNFPRLHENLCLTVIFFSCSLWRMKRKTSTWFSFYKSKSYIKLGFNFVELRILRYFLIFGTKYHTKYNIQSYSRNISVGVTFQFGIAVGSVGLLLNLKLIITNRDYRERERERKSAPKIMHELFFLFQFLNYGIEFFCYSVNQIRWMVEMYPL